MSLWSSESHTMDNTSNRSADEYIDDALISDSVKKLLSDNSDGNHFDLAADLLTHTNSAASVGPNCGQIGGHSGATVQEGMDLVDALDSLVQHLSRETKALPNDSDANNETAVITYTPFELIYLDHNYCRMDFMIEPKSSPSQPMADQTINPSFSQSSPEKTIVLNTSTSPVVQSSTFTSFNDNSYASSSTASATSPAPQTPGSPPMTPSTPSSAAIKSPPKTPTASRRSQRQIDRIEKSVLEKIKAENQEMLKREKEEMESPNKITRQTTEPTDDQELDDSQLVIDFDKKKDNKLNANQSNLKKRIKRTKSQTSEPTNKKSRMDSKQKFSDKTTEKSVELLSKHETIGAQKLETSEMDDVIAALKSGVTDSEDNDRTPGNGRQQRTRRKPKRWDDDEVEVDFSGQLGILAEQQKLKEENDENFDQSLDENANNKLVSVSDKTDKTDDKTDDSFDEKKSKENDSQDSNDDMDDESGSDFGSEDDPDKLWCICRQPHNDRFMIGCDSCEEWFHGKCVNVTKQQGRLMEKAGQEWLCSTCVKGIDDGVSRAELKRLADQKRAKLEAEERIRAQTKRAAKEKFLRKEKFRENTKQQQQKERRNSDSGKQSKSIQKPVSVEQKASVLAKKVSQMPPKKRELHLRQETEEKEKLKKLIQTSKQKLDKKTELLAKKKPKDRQMTGPDMRQTVFEIEPISKVVPIVRKPEHKKKHKDAIDPSVQDLFKAEPIKKAPSLSTPQTPTTPGTPGFGPFSRKSSVDSRRISTSGSAERQCQSGCGKLVKNDTTIYCSLECIESHVKERIKQLRSVRKDKLSAGIKLKEFDDRCVCVEKTTGRILSGKDGIPEKEVLEFIKTNQMFEIMKPPNIRDKRKDEFNSKSSSPLKSPKKEERSRSSLSRSNSRGESEGTDQIRANVKSSLKELLVLRCKEVNDMSIGSDEIRKTANRIEDELFKLFKETSNKYKNKYRSLLFNLKDPKNQGLFRKVVNGKISPERLVHMSAEELASSELAKWREREKISMLEMIKRDAAEKANQVIVKKTHKGEEVIESTIVNESPIDPKLDDLSQTNTNSVPNLGMSNILDDLMGSSNVDTTSQHRTHLFSNNCRICTKQQSDDSKQEVSKRATTQSSTKEETSRPTPKRVRVDPDSANKILLEAAKLSSSSAKRTASADDDDSHEVPTSTVSLSSPEVPTSSSASRPVWKGSVFMQDVAKFTANAIKVSGSVGDFLSQDISNQVTVIGRIAPEQVLDYVKKLRYSSRTEIGLIKFVSTKEERIGYDAFFDYLDTRKRYGVVGNTGKALKDFYILPLPRNGDVPDVLLPFDGPGLDKKSNRPNLLLGILIRSKGQTKAQTPQTSSTNTTSTKTAKTSNTVSNTPEFRSYTPPPKTSSTESSPEDSKDGEDVSYTPPRTATNSWKTTKSKTTADDDEPYDPEEAELSNSNSLSTTLPSTPSIEELMDQISKSTNPVEMTSSVLSAIAGSSNLDLQRRLLEQLTAKVDEQKRQLEKQKAEAEAQSTQSNNSSTLIPGLDGQFSANSLKDITIPENILDILSTVKQKTQEIEEQQQRLRAVAAAGFKFDDPIVKNFGSKSTVNDPIENSPEAEPMDLDEEVTPQKSTIIEVNTPALITTDVNSSQKSITDPRLRSKKQTPLPSIAQESGTESQVSDMTADELMQKAREQMAALAQMEANSGSTATTATTKTTTANSSTPVTTQNSKQLNNNSNKSQKIKIEWKKRKSN